MTPRVDLQRISLLAAVAGMASLAVADLLGSGDGFAFGLRQLARGILGEGLFGNTYQNGEAGGPIPFLCFAVALAAAAAAYVRSLAGIAAGTRLAAALVRRPGAERPGIAARLRQAGAILAERRRPAPERASAAIDALLTPIAGEGVTVTRLPATERPRAVPPWRARAGQRTGATANVDRWAARPADPDKDEQ